MLRAFDELLSQARSHSGQMQAAKKLRDEPIKNREGDPKGAPSRKLLPASCDTGSSLQRYYDALSANVPAVVIAVRQEPGRYLEMSGVWPACGPQTQEAIALPTVGAE